MGYGDSGPLDIQKMKILIAAVHWPVASGRYMRDAFRRLGVDVRTAGPLVGDGTEIWGIRVHPKHIWYPDYEVQPGGLLYIPPSWKPDLVLQMDTHMEYIGGWYPRAVNAIYSVDNHVRDLTTLGTDFDWYFMAHHDGPVMPVDENNPKHVWLPCAYDPLMCTPSPIPMAQRTYDVAMVGVNYAARDEIVKALRAAGLSVFAGMGLLYDDYAAIYHDARISLCVSAAGDVAMRIFETAAMGCAILSGPCTDFSRLGFARNTHYAEFGPPAQAVERAQWMLSTAGALD